MDWFEHITGFPESDYARTRDHLVWEGTELVSRRDGSRHQAGRFELVSLAELRSRPSAAMKGDRTTVHTVVGDARALHAEPEYRDATFQVASQFNVLEMPGPGVTPEDGVSGYAFDHTQGPACAMAAGAATIWRNYVAPVPANDAGPVQTAQHQLDGLRPLGDSLAAAQGCSLQSLWTMRNGYALCTQDGLAALAQHLHGLTEEDRNTLRGQLSVGVQREADVTDMPAGQRHRVTQVFCSALPVAYSSLRQADWQPFAQLVLEAAYEATFLAALETCARMGPRPLLLTRVGAGAFGNRAAWIDAAIERALRLFADAGLDVRLVRYG